MKQVPNYIACAAQIVTASKLGIQVGCLSLAKKVLETKSLPPTTEIGTFSKAARDAVEIVMNKGYGEEADAIAKQIIEEYHF